MISLEQKQISKDKMRLDLYYVEKELNALKKEKNENAEKFVNKKEK